MDKTKVSKNVCFLDAILLINFLFDFTEKFGTKIDILRTLVERQRMFKRCSTKLRGLE